ncbi:RING-H2 finger protein ATL56 [Striga hermonthica]|uniref:RING-H2 finger protein ATL56 n=1 Tax=Striga hermonthica TaxID=68872 RepID=A0A9N7R4Z8_STRHE|nr:RING-H2 finger protein ATL56 [Striga hermonthica]
MPTFVQENHRSRRLTPPQCLSRSQKKLLLFFLKCVIMVAVMSLFLFFLGFAAIVLLHFLFISSAFHLRCRPVASEASPLTQTLIPGVPYSAASFPATSDCSICLDSFRDGDLCRNIPICKHLFHAKCVDRWIGKNPTCPVCRNRVDLGCLLWKSTVDISGRGCGVSISRRALPIEGFSVAI